MRVQTALVATFLLTAFAGGCATPSAADIEYAQSARQSISAALCGFAEAIRSKDAAAASAFICEEASGAERAQMEHEITLATWMELYTGYSPDVERAMAKLNWRALRDGTARFKVRATNAAGFRFKDTYVATRRGDDWALCGITLQQPVQYERLDPPQDAAREISSLLDYIFTSLKEGRPFRVLIMLPRGAGLRNRTRERTFSEKLFGESPPSHSIDRDLLTMCEFSIPRWPDPAEGLPLGYIASDTVVACYDIPYTWFEGGIDSPDNLRMEIFLRRREGKWELLTFRLYGEAFPDT